MIGDLQQKIAKSACLTKIIIMLNYSITYLSTQWFVRPMDHFSKVSRIEPFTRKRRKLVKQQKNQTEKENEWIYLQVSTLEPLLRRVSLGRLCPYKASKSVRKCGSTVTMTTTAQYNGQYSVLQTITVSCSICIQTLTTPTFLSSSPAGYSRGLWLSPYSRVWQGYAEGYGMETRRGYWTN